jgi:hypothetical protein
MRDGSLDKNIKTQEADRAAIFDCLRVERIRGNTHRKGSSHRALLPLTLPLPPLHCATVTRAHIEKDCLGHYQSQLSSAPRTHLPLVLPLAQSPGSRGETLASGARGAGGGGVEAFVTSAGGSWDYCCL